LWGLILTLVTYPIVNQTVAQRIVGARSEMDARKGTIASLIPWCIITGISTCVGIMGVVLLPDLGNADADALFPLYMQRYLPSGVLGLGVASLVVASMSTGAGIGTAIAGLMTVDIFKYLGRTKHADVYRLRMTRVFASLAIICGTLFAMLIPKFGGMIPFYVAFTGTFFLPLTVPYIGGALYRKASRGSGMAALAGGVGVGTLLFLGKDLLPPFLGHPQWRPFWVFGFSWICLFLWSAIENRIRGPIPETDLASILNSCDLGRAAPADEVKRVIESRPSASWEGRENLDYAALGTPANVRWYSNPTTFEASAAILLLILMIWWW
jgi:Na+/proline symporter